MGAEDEPDHARIAVLHEHLTSTQELPVERTASRWIGEAEAIAADLVVADLGPTVVRNRLGHIRDLLDEIDSTGHPEADDHVEAAKTLLDDLLGNHQ